MKFHIPTDDKCIFDLAKYANSINLKFANELTNDDIKGKPKPTFQLIVRAILQDADDGFSTSIISNP